MDHADQKLGEARNWLAIEFKGRLPLD